MTAHEPDMFLCAEDRETLAKIRARLAAHVGDPLDASDHRTRHDADGEHWVHADDGWRYRGIPRAIPLPFRSIARQFGPLTFCDCPC